MPSSFRVHNSRDPSLGPELVLLAIRCVGALLLYWVKSCGNRTMPICAVGRCRRCAPPDTSSLMSTVDPPIAQGFPEIDAAAIEKVRLVASGGYAEVHLCGWKRPFGGLDVAVKALGRTQRAGDDEAVATIARTRKHIQRELRILRRLDRHLRITPVYGYIAGWGRSNNPNAPCIVMPYRRNGDISVYIQNRSCDALKRLNLALNILEGLTFMHSKQIAHGDLKPKENVLINDDGEAEPCDMS